MYGTDDPERIGWDLIEAALRNEGAFTFRMIPVNRYREVEHQLARIDCAITWWDVFDCPREKIKVACDDILATPRNDFVPSRLSAFEDNAFFERVQTFMAKCGVVPYPAKVLSGTMGQSTLAALTEPEDGAIAATAFSYFPYNRHSAHWKSAWAGMVAVREDLRSISVRVNALALRKVVDELGAERVQEYARPSNVPSCRIIERCGLHLRTDLRTGIAQPAGAENFTR